MDLFESCNTVRGFREGAHRTCDFSNFMQEEVLQKTGIHYDGTIFYKSVLLLIYADDIDVIDRGIGIGIGKNMDLAVNESKTVYMMPSAP